MIRRLVCLLFASHERSRFAPGLCRYCGHRMVKERVL